MRRAIELARTHMLNGDGGPFGAVVVIDGEIVAEGWNCVTSTNDPTAHAEVEAIREACRKLGTYDLQNAELYASCEPCPLCLSAAYWARMRRIYYGGTKDDAARHGFDDDFLYREIAKSADERKIPMSPMLRAEAVELFEAWDAKEDKTTY